MYISKRNFILLLVCLLLTGCSSTTVYGITNEQNVVWQFESLDVTLAAAGWNGFDTQIATEQKINSIEIEGLHSDQYDVTLKPSEKVYSSVSFFEYLELIDYQDIDQVEAYIADQQANDFQDEYQKIYSEWEKSQVSISDKLNYYDVEVAFNKIDNFYPPVITEFKINFKDGSSIIDNIGQIKFLKSPELETDAIINPTVNSYVKCELEKCVDEIDVTIQKDGVMEIKADDILNVGIYRVRGGISDTFINEAVPVEVGDKVTVKIEYKNENPYVQKAFTTNFEISGIKYTILANAFHPYYSIRDFILIDNGLDMSQVIDETSI